MRIKAFRALCPPAEIAHLVACVPYDTVSTEEARALANGNPWSFLRIVRPEIDLPRGADMYSDAVYARAAENFAKFQKEGILIRKDGPCLYAYRQKSKDHVQECVVACCHIEDYESSLIRRHETTREKNENDRTRHVKTLNANTSPVFLTYRDDDGIDGILASGREQASLFDFTAADGVEHTVWRITAVEELVEAFGNVPVCYIADGHHRTAGAVRVGIERRRANTGHTGQEEYNWFLAALFPANCLRILPYNRCVSDLNGMSRNEFLKAVKIHCDLQENAAPVPNAPRRVSMYLEKKWYGLSWDDSAKEDPAADLDVSFLQDRLLAPVLGIKELRTDDRIDFVGGIKGTGELTKRVDSGEAAVAFSMYAASVEQMMAVADADRIMPPKSTWFDPKPRSGLLVHTL